MAYTKENYPVYEGSTAIAGKKFLLYVEMIDGSTSKWELIGGQRDTGLEISAESIDATNKGSDGWGESIPGMKSWTSSPTLVCKTVNVAKDFLEDWVFSDDIQNDRPALHFAFVNSVTKDYYDSYGTVGNYSIEASYDDVMTVSMDIAGVCALTRRTNFDAATVVKD